MKKEIGTQNGTRPPTNTLEWLCHFVCLGKVGVPAGRNAPGDVSDAETDWPALLLLSQQHSVTPLLYYSLKTTNLEHTVPAQILQTLQRAYLRSVARNMRLYHELSQVLIALRKRNITVIVLKGAYLAKAVYDTIALRPMCDIDLLVKPNDAIPASKCLTTLGYRSIRPFWLEGRQAFHDHLPIFVQPERMPIEIHWQLALPDSPFTVDLEPLWQQAQPVSLGACQMYGLAPEHLILYLCLHAAYRHNFALGLQPLCDLTFLCEKDSQTMDWERLVSTAQQWKAEKSLYLGLYFAHKLFRAAIPHEIIRAIQPAGVTPQWLDWLQMRLLNPNEQIPPHFLRMWKAKGLRQKVGIAVKRMFLSPEEMGGLYGVKPNSLAMYGRYPHRIWALLIHHAHSIWRLARHDPSLIAAGDQQLAFREWLTTPNMDTTPLNQRERSQRPGGWEKIP